MRYLAMTLLLAAAPLVLAGSARLATFHYEILEILDAGAPDLRQFAASFSPTGSFAVIYPHDGEIFDAAFPEVRMLVGTADLHRWRGQLDYWVFLDGEVGQIAGNVNGEATTVVPEAIQGTVEVLLTATERGEGLVVYPPDR